ATPTPLVPTAGKAKTPKPIEVKRAGGTNSAGCSGDDDSSVTVHSILCLCSELGLHLFQPVRHPHLAVHRRRGGKMLAGFLMPAGPPVEIAEAGVAVGDER